MLQCDGLLLRRFILKLYALTSIRYCNNNDSIKKILVVCVVQTDVIVSQIIFSHSPNTCKAIFLHLNPVTTSRQLQCSKHSQFTDFVSE